MPNIATLLELVAYVLAVAFAIAVDPRLLIAEGAVASYWLSRQLERRPRQ